MFVWFTFARHFAFTRQQCSTKYSRQVCFFLFFQVQSSSSSSSLATFVFLPTAHTFLSLNSSAQNHKSKIEAPKIDKQNKCKQQEVQFKREQRCTWLSLSLLRSLSVSFVSGWQVVILHFYVLFTNFVDTRKEKKNSFFKKQANQRAAASASLYAPVAVIVTNVC